LPFWEMKLDRLNMIAAMYKDILCTHIIRSLCDVFGFFSYFIALEGVVWTRGGAR
jgi:hypothetical protein